MLGTGILGFADLGVVLAVGLTVRYSDRSIDMMLGSELIEEPRLRVEEAEGLLEIHLLLLAPREVIDRSLDAVVYEAILQVGKEVEPSSHLKGRLREAREIGLVGTVLVVALIRLYLIGIRGDGGTLSVVIPDIVVR